MEPPKDREVIEYVNDPICKNCGDSIWLHPEMDFNGLVGNGCDRFEAIDAVTDFVLDAEESG